MEQYPILDMHKTGQNIKQLMESKGLKVRDIQDYLGLATPQSIYHWFKGRNMPTADNLYALSELFEIPVDMILCGNRKISFSFKNNIYNYHLILYYEKLRLLNVG